MMKLLKQSSNPENEDRAKNDQNKDGGQLSNRTTDFEAWDYGTTTRAASAFGAICCVGVSRSVYFHLPL